MLRLTLPWPPSVNHYWMRTRHGRPYISARGTVYRGAVILLCRAEMRQQQIERMTGRLRVEIIAHPPDRRKRDLDNVLKSLLDSLQHAGVYEDDTQIDDLRIVRRVRDPKKKGWIEIEVGEHTE